MNQGQHSLFEVFLLSDGVVAPSQSDISGQVGRLSDEARNTLRFARRRRLMSLTVRATCLFAPPPPVAADMKEATEKIMAHLLGSDDVTDPTVEGDPVSETMAIEIDVDADELISA